MIATRSGWERPVKDETVEKAKQGDRKSVVRPKRTKI
jgi:hypothetical protein